MAFISYKLTRISSPILNRNHEDGHSCLVYILEGSIQYIILKCDVNSRLFCRSFYQIKFSSIFSLPRDLIINRCWVLLSPCYTEAYSMLSWYFPREPNQLSLISLTKSPPKQPLPLAVREHRPRKSFFLPRVLSSTPGFSNEGCRKPSTQN